MKKRGSNAKKKILAALAAGLITATQAQAALLAVDAAIDMTEYLAIGGVVAVSYLVIKGIEKGLGLLRRA